MEGLTVLDVDLGYNSTGTEIVLSIWYKYRAYNQALVSSEYSLTINMFSQTQYYTLIEENSHLMEFIVPNYGGTILIDIKLVDFATSSNSSNYNFDYLWIAWR